MFQASTFFNTKVPHLNECHINIDKITCSKEPSMFRARMFPNDLVAHHYDGEIAPRLHVSINLRPTKNQCTSFGQFGIFFSSHSVYSRYIKF